MSLTNRMRDLDWQCAGDGIHPQSLSLHERPFIPMCPGLALTLPVAEYSFSKYAQGEWTGQGGAG